MNFEYYTYEVGRDDYKPNTDKLVWNIFVENFNKKKIEVCNLFNYCWPFLEDLLKIKKKHGDSFANFTDEVRHSLQYNYWSKCEHETVICGWAREDTSVKIDVYTQIMMNWDRFIEYLWANKHLITRRKLCL